MTKLIQLNMWGGRLEGVLRDFFSKQSPDILCLQEAVSYQKGDAGFMLPVERIQEICSLPYMVFGPVFSFNLMQATASFGNCILSKYPIQKSEILFTNLEHKENFDFNEHDGNVRNFVHASIEIAGKTYELVTHHGYHIPDHKNGTKETIEQMRQLAEYVKQLEGPTILTGDFNLAPSSESLKELNNILTNLPVSHKLKTTRTPLTHKTEVCDYIFINDGIGVHKFSTSDEMISDHKALILEFET